MQKMSQPSANEVRKSCMETLADTHVVYVEAMRQILGVEGLKAIGDANRKHGLSLGNSAIQAGTLRRGDLYSIFEFFDAAYPYFGFELEVEDFKNNRLDLKVTSCPWLNSFKARDAGEDICTWITLIDDGIGQAVDPDVKLTIPKCMMRGDDYCIYRWTKEE
jgi:hypothetical protein